MYNSEEFSEYIRADRFRAGIDSSNIQCVRRQGFLNMARRRNAKGSCSKRSIEVCELNLCDFFKGKRKNHKPFCRNCSYFTLKKEEENGDEKSEQDQEPQGD